ncbi:hypothetical protein [Bradyrhizobium elkanii]|uniref:hypothetical protein n=1 Tax=Bradyrhizobium elkanii TaxID=29448 RepID=UPI001448A7CF|nr:hypothetical protein [Bradyrhizobium elkanii]MCP1932536.1 hypothetical protein [Bradyrhizobium elkanii]MCS3479537.1 hypothetical protein [Bradyrhizobium elkanii]MCS3576922.1 hypothetical protein [Bradyrhizobium elkanii]MCS3692029.1 hypothetical protein [Bradyrhizobium elkanii]MCS3719799.1 hypothetical protein [Bradyrhizobium elkanii]
MVFIVLTMKKHQHDNDNHELSFITLGMAVSNVVRYLELAKEHHEDAGSESDASNGKEQRGANHSEAVAHGVKKIIAFEQRARGKKSGSG